MCNPTRPRNSWSGRSVSHQHVMFERSRQSGTSSFAEDKVGGGGRGGLCDGVSYLLDFNVLSNARVTSRRWKWRKHTHMKPKSAVAYKPGPASRVLLCLPVREVTPHRMLSGLRRSCCALTACLVKLSIHRLTEGFIWSRLELGTVFY